MSINWQDARPFEDTNFHILQNGTLSDVTFLAGKGKKEVKAHKVILASRSPVFYNMFCGSLVEPSDVIEIPDIKEEILKDLLRFLYTEECDILPESVMALMYSAKKYEMKRLQGKCRTFLENGISVENVCVILHHASTFSENELTQKCFDFIFKNAKAILESGGIPCLSKDIFRKLIESDSFIANEVDIYEACKAWAVGQLNQKGKTEATHSAMREELGDLILSVRFPLMDQKEFANRISKEDILSSEEKLSIFRSFYSDSSTQNSDLLFSQSARHKKVTLLRFGDTTFIKGWTNTSQLYGIRFKVSRSVVCVGVSMFSPSEVGCISGSVDLLDGENVLTSREIKIEFQNNSHFKDILFEDAITLKSDKLYTIHQCMKGVNSYYGKHGQTICENDSFRITVEFSECNNKCSSATNVNNGQILGLIFYQS